MAATRKRRRAGRRASDRQGTRAWTLVLAGLALAAVGVTVGFYVRDKLSGQAADVSPTEASAPKARPKAAAKPAPSGAPPEKRYEFYDMLPNFEVVVPEEDLDVRPDKTPAKISVPGVYVLQAGSYAGFAEADKVKAQLALLGISSQIQKITVDDRTYHRVRIGPIESLDELNRTRQRLRNARVEALVIRVGE